MRISFNLLVFCFLLAACSNSSDIANAQGQKISQFEKAGYCDFLIDKSGVYHAVFQETPDFGKPLFIYYTSSANKGATWSKPITLSNDNTGNGAGYPRILQDGNGKIYAIWKRYGNTDSQYPEPNPTLDGPGGYQTGTLFYKVLNGGTWSSQVQLNELQRTQNSWFASITPAGKVCVFWTQSNPALATKTSNIMWYYCDYLRVATLDGIGHSAYVDINKPQPLEAYGYPAIKKGAINLSGYVDKTNMPHLLYCDNIDGVMRIKYFDGKAERIVYSYPKYNEPNTFNNPPKLLIDEKGIDHLVFLPSPKTLESEQVWDINLATNQTAVLTQIQKSGISILGFQANQGPNGAMAVTFEAGGYSTNTEAYGMFYSNGTWKNVGLTNNAAKEKFFYKEFDGLGGYRTYISNLTKYNSQFGSVAYDAAGHKAMLMTIAAYWIGSSFSISSPSVVYLPLE
jgi:hypothetical protein